MDSDLMRSRLYDKTLMSDDDSCWPWLGATFPSGYGALRVGKSIRRAHRVSYEAHNGPIPNGMHVLHTCDNPPCVNPHHLFIGTAKTNAEDRERKERGARGSANGNSKLTEDDVKAIQSMLAEGIPHVHIAEKFPITPRAVGYIASGDTWAHITPENNQ